jgi:hypothetical protein
VPGDPSGPPMVPLVGKGEGEGSRSNISTKSVSFFLVKAVGRSSKLDDFDDFGFFPNDLVY